MTGLCCRCQIRHDDELCCRHGVICHGDVAGPPEYGASDLVVLVAGTVVFAAVLGVCTWLGYNASDWSKVAAAFVLVALTAPVLAWAVRRPVDEIDPPAWTRPGTFSNNEPKEQ